MYFYQYEGQVYWGRHQALPPHRNFTTWIFRNKPMKVGVWYYSGGIKFKLHHELSGTMVIAYDYGDGFTRYLAPKDKLCYYIGAGVPRIVGDTHMHDAARNQFKRCFKNRLKEYEGRYFLPINKNMNYP